MWRLISRWQPLNSSICTMSMTCEMISGAFSVSVHILNFVFVHSVIGADAGNGIRVFIPDIGMFMVGLAIWLLCRSLVQKRPPEDMAQYNADFDAEEQVGFIYGYMESLIPCFSLFPASGDIPPHV